MRKNQTSLTAMGIALARAVETEKPVEERICSDPFARRFLPGWFYHSLRFFMKSGYTEWRGRGVEGFLVARERCIDDWISENMRQGDFVQAVILGAGFDSRAYRLEELRPPVRVFEVDHPATQRAKMDGVRRILGALPGHVTFVPVDFTHQSLAGCLAAHGYDPLARTLFVWQGVTYYLDAAAVDAALEFIASCSAPGSAVIFDCMELDLLRNPAGHGEVKGMRRYRRMTGEALRFGLDVEQMVPFLEKRGFTQVRFVRSEELKARYFHGKNERRRVAAGYAIVSAVITGQPFSREG